METPPPYVPPRKKSNTGLIIGIVVGSLVLCCVGGGAALFGGALWLGNKVKGMGECAMSYTFVQRAVLAYAEEHEGRLPNAKTWQDDIRPYYAKATEKVNKNQSGPIQFKPFPSEGEWVCRNDDKSQTGIAFNSDLSGKKLDDIESPSTTVLLFETTSTGRNQAMKYKPLDPKLSPRIFNEHRGWIVMTVHGKARMITPEGETPLDDEEEGGTAVKAKASASSDQ